jgi:hypothetical protein
VNTQLLRGTYLAVFVLAASIAIAAPVVVRWRYRRDCAVMAVPAAKFVRLRSLLGSEGLALWLVSVNLITAIRGLGWTLAILSMGLSVVALYLLSSAIYYRWLAIQPE